MEKLYEYEITIQLNYQFINRVSIDEQTKTVCFELIAIDVVTNEENWLIKDTKQLEIEQIILKIKDFLFAIIGVEAFRENIYNKTIEELDNGFKVDGKEFLLKDNKYTELRKKVLKKVKEYEENRRIQLN